MIGYFTCQSDGSPIANESCLGIQTFCHQSEVLATRDNVCFIQTFLLVVATGVISSCLMTFNTGIISAVISIGGNTLQVM